MAVPPLGITTFAKCDGPAATNKLELNNTLLILCSTGLKYITSGSPGLPLPQAPCEGMYCATVMGKSPSIFKGALVTEIS